MGICSSLHNCSTVFKCGNCAAPGRCWNSHSCFSNHDWTFPAVWMGALPSWNPSSLFGNNVCVVSLPNLSTYSLAVIRQWKIIKGQTEYHDIAALTITGPPSCRVSLLESRSPDCRLVSLDILQRQTLYDIWNTVKKPYHECLLVWYPGAMVVIPLFTHLSTAFSDQKFRNYNPTVDTGFVNLRWTAFVKTVSSITKNIDFCCHLCWSSCVIFRNIPSQYTTLYLFVPMLIIAHCSSLLMLSSYSDITLETFGLDTRNNEAVFFFSQMLQLSHGLSLKKRHSLMHWHEH
jgi:hypothetical protein